MIQDKQLNIQGGYDLKSIRRLIGVLLLLIGIVLIVSVVYKRIETNKKQSELKNILEYSIKETGEIDESLETGYLGYVPIGLIEIPTINLSQGLVEGVTDEILQYYIGHIESSAMPGEKGNFVIAGHRVSNYSEAFVNLYKLRAGDIVSVKSKGNEYKYKVTDNFVVEPYQVEVLQPTEKATITLITCTVGAKKRVIIKGELFETTNME